MRLLKLKEYLDTHREQVDVALGGSIGVGTGIGHYWEHFTDPENLYKLYDGIINTGIHTVVGAVILWAVHKYLLKSKK